MVNGFRVRIKKIQGERSTPEYVWVRNEDIVRVRKISVPAGDRYELLIRDLDMGQNILITEATEDVAFVLGLVGEKGCDPINSMWHPDYVKNYEKKRLEDLNIGMAGTPILTNTPIIPKCGLETAASEDRTITNPVEEIEILKEALKGIEETAKINIESNSDYTNNKKELAENLLDG